MEMLLGENEALKRAHAMMNDHNSGSMCFIPHTDSRGEGHKVSSPRSGSPREKHAFGDGVGAGFGNPYTGMTMQQPQPRPDGGQQMPYNGQQQTLGQPLGQPHDIGDVVNKATDWMKTNAPGTYNDLSTGYHNHIEPVVDSAKNLYRTGKALAGYAGGGDIGHYAGGDDIGREDMAQSYVSGRRNCIQKPILTGRSPGLNQWIKGPGGENPTRGRLTADQLRPDGYPGAGRYANSRTGLAEGQAVQFATHPRNSAAYQAEQRMKHAFGEWVGQNPEAAEKMRAQHARGEVVEDHGFGDWISGAASDLWNGVKSAVPYAWKAVKTVAPMVADTVADFIPGGGMAKKAAKFAMNALPNFAEGDQVHDRPMRKGGRCHKKDTGGMIGHYAMGGVAKERLYGEDGRGGMAHPR